MIARRRGVAAALLALALPVAAGPVEVYREGPQFCPRDRPANAAPLTQEQAIERARTLLPRDFCGPSASVSGCDVIPEYALSSWRIYFHQYKDRGGSHDTGGLTHTYVILDPVGNCYANIPGTELGAPR
ncbi:MAG TPA: hypothetical protein VGI14_16170 [Casimicrobiaceae bacterium]|jgi:hypothetical protein